MRSFKHRAASQLASNSLELKSDCTSCHRTLLASQLCVRPCMSAETSVVSGAAIVVSNRKRFNTAPRARFRPDGTRRRTNNELAKRARRREAKAKAAPYVVPHRPLRRAGMNLAPIPRAVDGQQEQARAASGHQAVSRSKEPSPDSPLVQDNGLDPLSMPSLSTKA